MDFGVAKAFSGLSVVGLPGAEIVRLTGSPGVKEIAVAAKPGVSQADLVSRIGAALGGGPRVKSGDQMRKDLANDATRVATEFTFILLIFGAISLVVAVFVIYNTFAILLAQRVRETALLRCVGATRRQIFNAVLAESAVVGLAGGAIGVLGGVGVVYGLLGLLNGLLRANIPVHAPVIGVEPVVIGLAIGLVVTVISALLPAIRATRTPPLAALRDLPTVKVTSRGRRIARIACTVLFGVTGIGLTVLGWREPDPQTGTFTLVAGGVITFLGVLILSPLFIAPLSALVGLPMRGTPGRLAVANARRNPGRTAVTTATLMIGVGMMALFSVILASVRTTAHAQIVGQYPVDYVMTPLRGSIPLSYVDTLRNRPELPGVFAVRVVEVDVDGVPTPIAAMDSSLPAVPAVAEGEAVLIGQRQGLLGRELKLGNETAKVAGAPTWPCPRPVRPGCSCPGRSSTGSRAPATSRSCW